MTVHSINNDSLVSMAKESKFNWMQSLDPIRNYKQPKRCCGRAPKPIPEDVIKEVAKNPGFLNDLRQVKTYVQAPLLAVSVSGYIGVI